MLEIIVDSYLAISTKVASFIDPPLQEITATVTEVREMNLDGPSTCVVRMLTHSKDLQPEFRIHMIQNGDLFNISVLIALILLKFVMIRS